jgi:hypothetical protein
MEGVQSFVSLILGYAHGRTAYLHGFTRDIASFILSCISASYCFISTNTEYGQKPITYSFSAFVSVIIEVATKHKPDREIHAQGLS